MMEKKAAAGMMVTLLLIGIFTAAFNIPSTLADVDATTSSNDHVVRQAADGQDPSFSMSPYEKSWDFNRAGEWGNFARVNNDSMEMVIGISYAKPNGYEQLRQLIIENGELVNTVSMNGEVIAVVADVPVVTASTFAEEVRTSGLSRYVEPNLRFQASFVPNDPYWPQQWGPAKIEADYAWNTTTGDPSILVAVIDTGVDWNHPDLTANYIALGYDWVNNDTDPIDDHGHGTHCAGIIAAALNNSIGIAGLAQVHIMAEKGIDEEGWGTEDDLANALIHAADQGANIMSMSWGSYYSSSLIYDALEYAYNRDVLLIAAAGNEATSAGLFPAAWANVVAVTATDQDDDPAFFTNYGYWVELAAPGVNVFSTISEIHNPRYNYPYDSLSGTSMAVPHVAGVAALVWSRFPDMTRDRVRLHLRYTAEDLGAPRFDVYYGYGRINARRAVEQTPPNHDLAIDRLITPKCMQIDTEELIPAILINYGMSSESNITVYLIVDGSIVDCYHIDFLEGGKWSYPFFLWGSAQTGFHNVTFYVAPMPDEANVENNAASGSVYVRPPEPMTIRVPDMFLKIQQAIDAAVIPGDKVSVSAGTYYEKVSINNKNNLTLIGEDRETTIIDGLGGGTVVKVKYSKNVRISGFTIRNSAIFMCCGLLVISNYTIITNNIVANNSGCGIYLYEAYHNIVSNNVITNNTEHIGLFLEIPYGSYPKESWNTIEGNIITNNDRGVGLTESYRNTFKNNIIADNRKGIFFLKAQQNIFEANVITNNDEMGVWMLSSCFNVFFHNDFVDNGKQVFMEEFGMNTWDDGWPSGGNYWSDHTGVDWYSGPYQNETGSDGIVDIPYGIKPYSYDNRDNYPLTKPYMVPHDIGILNVTTTKTVIGQGFSLRINVKIFNYGMNAENFNVTAYANTTNIQTKNITLATRNSTTITFTWNTTGVAKGSYIITAEAEQVPGEIDTTDNTWEDGTVTVIVPGHDVAIKDVTSKTVVGQNFSLPIFVTAKNYGNFTETFSVTAYYDSIPIETKTVTNLPSGIATTLTFTWNTTGVTKGNYTISAYAWPVPGETDLDDNMCEDGTVIVAMPCDVAGSTTLPPPLPDGKVDYMDLFWLLRAYGSNPSKPNWDPNLDFAGDTTWPPAPPDDKVDYRDVYWMLKYYGKTDP